MCAGSLIDLLVVVCARLYKIRNLKSLVTNYVWQLWTFELYYAVTTYWFPSKFSEYYNQYINLLDNIMRICNSSVLVYI